MQYSIINYSHRVVHYIPKTYLFCNWKFVLVIPFAHFACSHSGKEGFSGGASGEESAC